MTARESGKRAVRFDEIGYWSEVKLDIVRDYAREYSKILSAQRSPELEHVYIDAFAGAGLHLSKHEAGKFIPGSPLNALSISPPFKRYYLIDLDNQRIEHLRKLIGSRKDVQLEFGDSNLILKQKVFPQVRFDQYRRGLCLLDPYGLHLNWEIIETAGKMASLEIFLNFPIADMNRNVLWHDRTKVRPEDVQRMNAYWGDDSWERCAYTKDLFGYDLKEGNPSIAKCFSTRLREIAGFKYVSEPLPMRNSNNAVIYYLFFASQRPVAKTIVDHIFRKYKNKGK